MASPVPAKSQPLHNFSLPLLKWNKNHTANHHRGRRSSPPEDSNRREESAAARRQSPAYEPESKIEKSEKKPVGSDADDGGGGGAREVRSKIYIRLRTKNKPDDDKAQDEGKTGTEDEGGEGEEEEEAVAKTWNLRPRKPIRKQSNGNGGVSQENRGQLQPNQIESVRLPEAGAAAEKRQKFSVSLSRREIEEDVFAMTGSKPARRPKKRAKIIQKQLDNLFPGLWLASITPDSYKVSDAPAKG